MLTATSHLAGSASPTLPQSDPTPRQPRRRAGIAALWIVLVLPLLVLLIFFAVNIGNQWNARVELENSLEAAALAAVKEWAEGDGDSTLPARLVGQQYAAANYIGRCPVEIGLNYDPDDGGVNENAECCLPDGNFVFGAVFEDENDPDRLIFNAGERPSCGIGEVLFDASAQGGGGGGGGKPDDDGAVSDNNWWGISFQYIEDDVLREDVRITKIEIDLRAKPGTIGRFSGPVELSDNWVGDTGTNFKVNCPGKGQNPDLEQDDISGFSDPDNQIQFSIGGVDNSVLTIEFFPDDDGDDDGFASCDRFRFGLELVDVGLDGGGNTSNDGDGVGYDSVGVKVYFNDSDEPGAEGAFVNEDEKKNDCCKAAQLPNGCDSLTPNPAGIPDLPCPPSSSAKNNGQSYVLTGGTGGSGKFAVRAQAKVPVPNLMSNFCGIGCGPSYVTACTTAIYDCTEGRPRLVRIDKYICPGPEEDDE